MDTTQKPRQENQNRRPPDAGTQKRPRPTGEQPPQRPVRETRENREKATEARQPAQRQRPSEERRRAPAENTERPKRPAENAERPKRPAENAERPKRPAENAERPKRPAENAERPKRPAENAERPKRPAENAERPKRTAEKAEKPKRQKAPAPRKRSEEKKDKGAKKRRPAEDPEDVSNKKRAYGNSKPKKKSAVVALMDSIEQSAKKSAEKRKKTKKNRPKQPTPAVIYTQPAAFNRNRLIIQLVTVTAVVLALVIGLSVFFKVEHIYVSGAKVYSESSITEVCGISKGDNLLTFSHARAAALIQANRPYVREVRFGIKLPDTVNIIVEEDDVVYAIKDQTGQWWLMNSDGRVVEQGNNAKVTNNTQVLGVSLQDPVPNERGVALESAPAAEENATAAEGETVPSSVPVTTTGAQRLDAALQILKALEDNDIVGSAASVDVSRIDDIILWYGTRYQVNLGDNTRLEHKIACMNAVIAQMSEYQSGVLDCSFTIWPNQVGYTPFS
ncbi:MAG: FtsQ-type POTRA domain-containing protein [Clostridiales bacterium]|nr:FtsQ-type POTRA domain-containing protein [Clostridiales bacterium]